MMHKCRDINLSYLEAALRRGASKGDDKATTLIQQKQKDDTVGANVAMGLKPQQLTKQEQPLFGSRSASYLRVREKILLKWCQDCKHPVDIQELLGTGLKPLTPLCIETGFSVPAQVPACLGMQPTEGLFFADDADDRSLSVTKDAYHFLQENGYINFGVLQELKPKAQVKRSATVEQPREQQQKSDSDNSEAAIVFKLYELLRAADMETTSEKALRKELQKHFSTDISTKKALVKEHVNYFIQHLEQKDTLKPKGYEEMTHSDKAADTANTMPRKQAAAKAAAKANREVAAAPPPKPAGRVVVVGAGPAGLAAATLLQRVGVDVVVLEARDRVGGRVHSYKGDFDAPVELGASLITSTQAETREGLALDPLGVVCKQLGMQLHQLKDVLPLHYPTGCKDTDINTDELRDQLLDCALNAAGEAGAAKQSLGQALQQALELRLRAAAATSSCCDSPSSAAAADTHQSHQDNDATQPQQHHQTPAADPRAQQQQQQQQGRQMCRLEPTQEITHKAEIKPILPPGLDLTSDTDKKPTYGDLVAAAAAGAKPITADMLDVLDWHWAYLEYICGVSLYEVSLALGEQGLDWGRFGGRHSMVVGGFDKAMQGLAKQLGGNLHLSTPVHRIEYPVSASEQQQHLEQAQEGVPQHESDLQQRQSQQQAESVRVTTAAGEVYECSAVLVTLPLGVLKAGSVEFAPPLPDWKVSAVQALGFGDLNKVVLQFPTVFWEDKDSFGITQPAGAATRGRCFMFWSLAGCTGVPLLSALVSGQAARAAEDTPLEDMVQHVMQVLRCIYGDAVPEPVASYATKWGSDEFSRGSYSYVAVGCSGDEYDVLAAPVASRVLFAGEHTCKEHPGSVQGAMLSGMREAARALHLLRGASAAIDDLGRTGTSSRADVEGEEEECEVASEADDAAEEQRVIKQTSGKKREKKAKQQKLNRKQKAGAGAEGSDDEDLKHGGQRGARERRPAGITPAEMQSQLQQRQHLQNHLNRLWKGFIDAQTGDARTVLDVLNNCSSLEERQQCVAAVMRAPAEAVQNLSEHAKFLEVVFSWLEELLPERSDANLHVTKKLLELLAKLTSSWAAITAVPQFMKVLKAASEHRNKEVAQMGAAVRRSWMSRNPSKPTQESTPRRPSSAAQGSAASQAAQQKQQHCPSSLPSSISAHSLAAAAATGAGAVGGADELADLVDADSLQELEHAQAALQAAKEQAAHEAALLAAMQQEPLLPNSGRMRFDTFGEYTRVTKRQQQDAKDEAMEQQVPSKRSKHQRDGHHWQHQQQQRKQESAAADEKQRPGSGIGADAKDAGVKELRDFIKSRLKPRFQSKQLDQEGCKWVLQRVQDKVLKNTTALEVAEGGFLTGKRAKKVADLVDSYVDRRKADVSKELKLAAVKAAPARAAVMPVTTAAAPPKPPTRSKWDQPA